MSKRKALKILIIIAFIVAVLIVLYVYVAKTSYNSNKKIIYGTTFTKSFAKYLDLDWRLAYTDMLDDLKVRYIRLPVYWDEIEPEKDLYNFTDIDWQVAEAEKRDAHLILVLGRRQPRWPECHDPAWVEGTDSKIVREKVLKNMELVINRYKNNRVVEMWQVENEPFLDFFGQCPKISKKELKEEIALVKSLDKRKVLITDSGELSTWWPGIKCGDIFGTTLYRTTYNKYIGYWHYFFVPPSFYRVKAYLWGKPQEAMYVAELQAEPWFPDGPKDSSLAEQYKTMNAKELVKNAEYADKTNFYRAYFWGVEWWYWLKTIHNDNSVWEAAKQYFK
ncbi:MAG: hypothetical protein A2Y82_00980 [Candidatus Buchananbacteria bacterium RBG_13_36_9]|uniref:Glycoside hydrolase family 5 domain-containing protein n=1 Tax=Candidatus Buchananbacteria bacterium RBG_13_36_9 TaxID=1797530 RepID=A0A1G1XNG3_9BACT|nr:MAG: hypothetical protein A2Y82_00980 [Candidatus Buchananbacteria bacterium RBG_13_36_9]